MNRQTNKTSAYREYEAGKDFKRQIGLYSRVCENERYYRGEQWTGISADSLPTPTFNIIRRITDYLVSSAMSYKITVKLEDDLLDLADSAPSIRHRSDTLTMLERDIRARLERSDTENVFRNALRDSLLCGDGILYSWYDSGDIRTATVDSVNVFAADMNCDDIQSQKYIILSGRESVDSLRAEAIKCGCSSGDAAKIVADGEYDDMAGDLASDELNDGSGKATYVIKFSKDEHGYVRFEKCTRELIIKQVQTSMRHYPITKFSWINAKNSFHGTTPISELIGNQKYINKGFAMQMKHMTDTAFSKVIYDKRLIPEWTNEVGQAIGVMSGGDVSGAVTTVGVGEMQDGYLDLLDRVITYTKEMTGVTEVALGEVDPTNTSAIIALREASELPLENIRTSICKVTEELALIWLDIIHEYFPIRRTILIEGERYEIDMNGFDIDSVNARAILGDTKRYSGSIDISVLNRLLEGGYIEFDEYLERLPDGVIGHRDELIKSWRVRHSKKEESSDE